MEKKFFAIILIAVIVSLSIVGCTARAWQWNRFTIQPSSTIDRKYIVDTLTSMIV